MHFIKCFLLWCSAGQCSLRPRHGAGSAEQCLICLNNHKSWKHEVRMSWKYFVTILNLPFINCGEYEACFPSLLCNTTFSDPRNLKTMSDNLVHIGVSLKIIDKNNNRENVTGAEFNEAFKVCIFLRALSLWLSWLFICNGRYLSPYPGPSLTQQVGGCSRATKKTSNRCLGAGGARSWVSHLGTRGQPLNVRNNVHSLQRVDSIPVLRIPPW